MSETKETKKKAATKKTAAKKETVKKAPAKKAPSKTATKKTSTKKTSAKKVTKPIEEKVVINEEAPIEINENVVEEPVNTEMAPVEDTEIQQSNSEPDVEISMSTPIEEAQPVYNTETSSEEYVYKPPEHVSEPANDESMIQSFESLPEVEGYRARPITEIINQEPEEVPNFEPGIEPSISEQSTNDEQSTMEEPVVIPEPSIVDNSMEIPEPIIDESNVSQQEEQVYDNQVVSEINYNFEPTDNEEVQNTEEPMINDSETVVSNEHKKKKDIRSILLVLLFVLLFGFIMFMPQIQDILNNIKKDMGLSKIEKEAKEIEKEQNKEKSSKTTPAKSSDEQYSTLTCTSTTVALESYDRIIVETFEYNTNKEVMKSEKKVTYKFAAVNDSYESLKTQCTENSLKYIDKKGYETACNYNDLEVVMEDKFNLKDFSTIKDGTNIISSNAKYKENIDTIKARLEASDYTCQ